jgi:hypothetical protein
MLHTKEGVFKIRYLFETLKFQNFKILSLWFCFWTLNNSTKMPSDMFYDEIRLTKFSFSHSESVLNKSAISFVLWWTKLDIICGTKLDKIVILPYFPYNPKVKLRLEVLLKKFHPRINLATLFSIKSYLLNTIKLFSGHENRSLAKSQKPLQVGYP